MYKHRYLMCTDRQNNCCKQMNIIMFQWWFILKHTYWRSFQLWVSILGLEDVSTNRADLVREIVYYHIIWIKHWFINGSVVPFLSNRKEIGSRYHCSIWLHSAMINCYSYTPSSAKIGYLYPIMWYQARIVLRL